MVDGQSAGISKRDVALKCRALLKQASELESSGRVDEARSLVREVLDLDPHNNAALKMVLRRAVHQRDRDTYLHFSRFLVEAEPAQTEAVAKTLLRFGSGEAAADVLGQSWDNLSPEATERLRDEVLLIGGRLRKDPLAAARLMLLAADDERHSEFRERAKTMLGAAVRNATLALREGRRDEALALFKRIIEVAPDNVPALSRLVEMTASDTSIAAYAGYSARLLALSFNMSLAIRSLGKAVQAKLPAETSALFCILVNQGRRLQSESDESVLAYCRRIASRVIRIMANAKGANEEFAALRAMESMKLIARNDVEAEAAQHLIDVHCKRLAGTLRQAMRNKSTTVVADLLPHLIRRSDFSADELSQAAIYLCANGNAPMGREMLMKLNEQGRCVADGLAMLGILAHRAGQISAARDYASRVGRDDGRLPQRLHLMLETARQPSRS